MFTTKNKTLDAIRAREKQLENWSRNELRSIVHIDPSKHRKWRPRYFVKSSPLFQAMSKVASDINKHNGKVWVLYAKPCSGKTVTGRFLMEHAAKEFQIKRGLFLTKEDEEPLVTKVAKMIGAPEIDDLSWVNSLFEALSGTDDSGFDTLRKSAMAACCYDSGSHREIRSVTSFIGNEAPIIVFDDVRGEIEVEDRRFYNILFELCNLRRVNVFILTDDHQTANDLCRMDGRNRVKPLPGFYRGRPTGQDDVNWTEEAWLVEDLSKLIFAYYPRIKTTGQYVAEDGNVTFVKDGTLPDTALEIACEIDRGLGGWQGAILSTINDHLCVGDVLPAGSMASDV